MSSQGRDLDPATTRFAVDAAGDDLLRIVSTLTQEVERFDAMLRNQRDLMRQHSSSPSAFDDRLIRLKSKRIRAGVIGIVTRAQIALSELRGLGHSGEPVPSEAETRPDS